MAETANKKLTASMEDYLEAILLLIRRKRVARVRDIAKRLGVAMPSVTSALKSLSKRELVNYDPYEVVTLTDAGRQAAEEIAQRHAALRVFLIDVLGLDEDDADANACRLEHAVDDALLARLKRFARFIHTCPRAGEQFTAQFRKFCQATTDAAHCRQCLTDAVASLDKAQQPDDD